jgi:Oxidoreductase-like protein, N-terminal
MSEEPVSDPKPMPPIEPSPEECCGGGCAPCVYDRYYDALTRYRENLRLWELRHSNLPEEPDGDS